MQLELSAPTITHPLQGAEPLTYKGERVLTTEMAATAFEVEVGRLGNNFDRNRGRFEEGKHFHKVEGADLRVLKDRTSLRGSVGANARSLILWTERGIARHAKMLESDSAWAIFEALEDTYFRVKADGQALRAAPVESHAPAVAATFRGYFSIGRLIGLDRNQSALAANRATAAVAGVDALALMGATHLVAPQQEQILTPTDIGRELGGLSGIAVNNRLAERGLQEGRRDAKDRAYWVPTEVGQAYAVFLDTGKKHSDGTPVRQLKWTSGVISLLRGCSAESST